MFESVKARLEKLLRDHSRSDPRAYMSALREALLEAKVGVATMRSALVKSEEELRREQRQLTDAERRGRLALEVPDQQTVTLAEQFARRHRERIAVLERKISVQRDELVLAQREVEEMLGQVRGGSSGARGGGFTPGRLAGHRGRGRRSAGHRVRMTNACEPRPTASSRRGRWKRSWRS